MIKKNFLMYFQLLLIFTMLSCGTDFTTASSGGNSTVLNSSENAQGESDSTAGEEAETEELPADDDDDDDDESVYEVLDEEEPDEVNEELLREWTILVYMAADNNLESEAITDFNEMEAADLSEAVTVLVLLDRAEGYDATNDDWSGTRLYKVTKDENQNKTLISSERLSCDELALSSESESELDMSNPHVLSGFEAFARRAYPAENYALVIWGHGSGWRNEAVTESSRAVAIESSAGSYMSISELRSAISDGMGSDSLSMVCFDTCFGMCIETAYELRDCASYMLGTPALESGSGWNYTKLLSSFSESERDETDLINAICTQFKETYENYSYASFSCVNLSKIEAVVKLFSSYSKTLASTISTKETRDAVFEIFTKKAVSYCATEYPTDFYVDIKSLSSCLDSYISGDSLRSALDEALVCDWSALGNTASLGVFFCVYKTVNLISPSHPSLYINGSRDTLLSKFVSDCTGYVPTSDKSGSLLDKLFYTSF
ncbi:MAG: hypothetical protein IJ630_10645 [Treponema sp.]|nr:hypothetical protein [Treponema sp.]